MTKEEAIKEIQDASDYEVRHGDIEHHHEDIMRRVEAFEKAVNALQKEPEWIPTSKRLPDSMGMYLVTLEYKEHGKAVTTLWYHGEGIGWDLRVADVVVAWMPLLEPYGEGAEECKAPSEWQQDHAILKAHSDGANEVVDRIKEAREEIDDLDRYFDNDLYTDNTDSMFKCNEVLAILDKLIAEVEGTK